MLRGRSKGRVSANISVRRNGYLQQSTRPHLFFRGYSVVENEVVCSEVQDASKCSSTSAAADIFDLYNSRSSE